MRSRKTEGARFKRSVKRRRFLLPSWWFQVARGRPASFWLRVERLRLEVGASRHDVSAITYIIQQLQGVRHERQHQQGR